ncbi:beta-propeller fold lactonase family protein [Pseudomonas gozinkensis]|uniref:beta-propeller fold lactonase family protein n=1 Tax=Pseudomonas gozinkensis TaxID=2774461 RepID=UPI00178880C6|nr:YncE family protein [Pseudomonas gozinkensis]
MSVKSTGPTNAPNALPEPFAPKIPKATGAGDHLNFNDMYSDNELIVQVPHYTGMARGHTVRITFDNPRHTYHSAVVTVGTPGVINVPVPRVEVVDAIGHTVSVYYTVRETPGTALIYSRTQLLHIAPYPFDLRAPTLASDKKTLSVSYVGMITGYTVRIRAVGKTVWESDERKVQTGTIPTFTLSGDWLAANKGVLTLINYSVYKSGSGERLMFSKVLREMFGEAEPDIPTITSLVGLPSNVEIPDGGTTSERLFAMSGKARANATCYLRIDGVRQQGLIAVDGSRNWTYNTGTQTPGLHSYAVEGNYDSGPVSAPPRTLRIGLSATIPVGDSPSNVLATPDGSRVYVCNYKGSSVSVIDTASQTVIKTISVEQEPSGIAVHPNGLVVYVCSYSTAAVSVIDTRSLTVITTVKIGGYLTGIVVHPSGSRIYACQYYSGAVAVIDTQNMRVIKTIENLPASYRVAIHPDGSHVYVTRLGYSSVSVIDTRSETVIKTISAGQKPRSIAVRPGGTVAYVTDYDGGTVLMIDTRSLTVITVFGVGRNPESVAFHPDGSRAYVSLHTDNLVAVIDTQSHAVINTVSAGQSPGGITVLPDGTLLYVTNAPSSTVSVIAAK